MKQLKSLVTACLMAAGIAGLSGESYSQAIQSPRLIAILNRADWCAVCKANEPRFEKLLTSYAAKGIIVYLNDVTNDSASAASRKTLQAAGVYDAVTAIPRKGVGKILQYCGLAKDKKQSDLTSGTVTFISPATHQPLRRESIAVTDARMKSLIDNLLND
ncbi:thioredoxin domain-containing protein [Chitinophagaceae bacterium MMS25-I14]